MLRRGLSRAEAGLSRAEAGLSRAEAGLSRAEEGLSRAEAVCRAGAVLRRGGAAKAKARRAAHLFELLRPKTRADQQRPRRLVGVRTRARG